VGISPVATGDQRRAALEDFAFCGTRPRLRALDGRHLLEKVDENFSQKSFFICFGAVPLSVVGWLVFVSFYDRREGTADSGQGPPTLPAPQS